MITLKILSKSAIPLVPDLQFSSTSKFFLIYKSYQPPTVPQHTNTTSLPPPFHLVLGADKTTILVHYNEIALPVSFHSDFPLVENYLIHIFPSFFHQVTPHMPSNQGPSTYPTFAISIHFPTALRLLLSPHRPSAFPYSLLLRSRTFISSKPTPPLTPPPITLTTSSSQLPGKPLLWAAPLHPSLFLGLTWIRISPQPFLVIKQSLIAAESAWCLIAC